MPERVDYDRVAASYDARYATLDFSGVERALVAFVEAPPGLRVLEVGCGTGHWLEVLTRCGACVSGLDRSAEMLRVAASRVPGATLVEGDAGRLPWGDASFDRVVCVNAIHHFPDGAAFVAEARRVLAPGGALQVIGLDPSRGDDRSFVYDAFDGALATDLRRYPTTATVEEWAQRAGLVEARTTVAHRLQLRLPARAALDGGLVGRTLVSQLALLDDATFDAGIERLRRLTDEAEARGEEFFLVNDVALYATTARAPG
jgi:SAM-dependent methyltransferase